LLYNRCLIHFHIPRTGGTWLRQSLIQHLRELHDPDQLFFVDGGPEWDCAYGTYQDLLNLSATARSRLRLITGHMPIDVLDFFGDARGITVMRDPLERCLSDYWHCFSDENNPAHKFARSLSLVEFCVQGFGQARNGHSRYLSGAVYSRDALSDEILLDRARTNLEKFALVGIFENMHPFIHGLERFGIRNIELSGYRNRAMRFRKPSPDEAEALKGENRIDYSLAERILS
jgi:hypothetical protein